MSLIISVSGLRGIVGQSLTPESATDYVAAFAASLDLGERVIVSRDGRTTGPMLRSVVVGTLMASGIRVIDVDVAATPTVGVLVRQTGAAGAVQITASHNPPPYNGMKLFGRDGRVVDPGTGKAVKEACLEKRRRWADYDALGVIETLNDPHTPHIEAVLATVDVDRIRSKEFRVVVDANHGGGAAAARRLLEHLGCDVSILGESPTGEFIHPPEPTAENLSEVGRQIFDAGAAVGFCQDPDADRLALIDENGRYVGEEFTVAVCVQRILTDPETRGPIVINGATSGMSERLANDAGVGCHRSPVGEANVADLMLDVGAVYGGEGSGGPIDPRVGLVRDSLVGMAQVLDHMARTGRPLSTIVDALPQLSIVKSKINAGPEDLPEIFSRVRERHPEATVDETDGLRLAFPDGRWLLVRGSNTEPIVRFIAEAESEAEAEALIRSAAEG